MWRRFLPVSSAGALFACYNYSNTRILAESNTANSTAEDQSAVIINWSGTHQVEVLKYHSPESIQELKDIVSNAKGKLRPIGSALSPNGIAFCNENQISMAHLDKVISVDVDKKQVTVQPGIRVEQIVQYLKPYGLTLENFASISEQQLGGYYQVSAHGTGAKIPPVDEQILSMKLLTPAKGELFLSRDSDPELFQLAKVGLGTLGIVTEMTIQCVPRYLLHEKTFVLSRKQLREQHLELLESFKHVRYMWLPYTDSVVVVGSNPTDSQSVKLAHPKFTMEESLSPLRNLVRKLLNDFELSNERLNSMSFADLRDIALMKMPLNLEHVIEVNKAEEEFWKRSAGERVDWSENVLGFECGGQQWVSEVAFPVPSTEKFKDLDYIEEISRVIENNKIPAPAPIEQRWTCGSSSKMSPAHGSSNDLFSWVGIIMYLPAASGDDPETLGPVELQRHEITKWFDKYKELCYPTWKKYHAFEHWAKVEIPHNQEILSDLKDRMKVKYPVEDFIKARKSIDPDGSLSNDLIKGLFE
jgi:L-galactono-1,4-lactone dehydrogenase